MSSVMQKQLARQSAEEESIRALVAFLTRICDRAPDYASDAGLAHALLSQGALAKYAEPNLRIQAMSLNHQKKVASRVLGAYGVLDALRVSARDAVRAAYAPQAPRRSATRAALQERIRELEAERAVLLEDLFILQRAYDLRCVQARTYAGAADASTQLRCAKEQKEVDSSFSLRQKRVQSGNVYILDTVIPRA